MSGLGGLNKSPQGVVIGLMQLQLPVVTSAAELEAQCHRVCELVAKERRSMPSMDLVVFPEYALHGLSMDTRPEIMCSLDGPEVSALRAARTRSGAASRSWSTTPRATPTTAGSSSTPLAS